MNRAHIITRLLAKFPTQCEECLRSQDPVRLDCADCADIRELIAQAKEAAVPADEQSSRGEAMVTDIVKALEDLLTSPASVCAICFDLITRNEASECERCIDLRAKRAAAQSALDAVPVLEWRHTYNSPTADHWEAGLYGGRWVIMIRRGTLRHGTPEWSTTIGDEKRNHGPQGSFDECAELVHYYLRAHGVAFKVKR